MIPPSSSGAEVQHHNASASVFGGRRATRRIAAAVASALLLAGCASVGEPALDSDDPGAECRAYFRALDAAVEEAGVRDGIGAPAQGFPYLRATRFLNSFHDQLDDPAVRTAWLDETQRLDREARLLELAHLGENAAAALPVPESAVTPERALTHCSDLLRQQDLLDADAGDWRQAADALTVPDEYITWHRVLGVYPVSRWFIRGGVAAWQRGVRESFDNVVAETEPAYRYGPSEADPNPREAADRLAVAPRNALGWPELTSAQWQAVFAAFAPVIELEEEGEYNRIGQPFLGSGETPEVDTGSPVVYTEATGTRYGEETLVQLNYTWWFTERPLDYWFDLLGGALDGLTLRLTLDDRGRLLLVETMHNCGCYHQHYPVQGLLTRSRPDYAEPPLVLPGPGRPEAGERLRLRLDDGSHYVTALTFASTPEEAISYRFADYKDLRSVRAGNGGRRSLFQPDGLVAGSERSERWFFWVSGVPEAGAMRQRHRHATAFVGRRHFDAPDLLERTYERVTPE